MAVDNNTDHRYDGLMFYDYHPGFPGSVPGYSQIYLEFADFTQTVFSDLSLPSTINLGSFGSQNCEIATIADGAYSGVLFNIAALTEIPEPTSVTLFGSCTLITAASLCRKRRRTVSQ